ncbi:N-acetylmuramoyl-L-alanine amidase [Flavisolibacter sp. BT320]|nr:N-acetylmuramoyl-L-alanine amidase [Flavisolibacter longurius]
MYQTKQYLLLNFKRWRFVLLLAIVAGSCATGKKAARSAADIVIVPRSGWNAAEAKPFQQHVPVRITVHHEGTRLEIADNAAKKIKAIQTWGMGPDRKWADIPYHFLIAPDGTIYEGRNVFTAGETATEYDPSGHLLITCLGNLEVQEVRPEQLQSLIKLIAFTSKKYNLPIETISTHRDNSTQTTCPGKNLYRYFENGYVKTEAAKLLKKR